MHIYKYILILYTHIFRSCNMYKDPCQQPGVCERLRRRHLHYLVGISFRKNAKMLLRKVIVACFNDGFTSLNLITILCRDLNRFVRNQIIFANTLFKAVCYQPAETQLLSGGSDRKVIRINYS